MRIPENKIVYFWGENNRKEVSCFRKCKSTRDFDESKKMEKIWKRRKAGFLRTALWCLTDRLEKSSPSDVSGEWRKGWLKKGHKAGKTNMVKQKLKKAERVRTLFLALTRKGSTEVLSNQRLPSFCNHIHQRLIYIIHLKKIFSSV